MLRLSGNKATEEFNSRERLSVGHVDKPRQCCIFRSRQCVDKRDNILQSSRQQESPLVFRCTLLAPIPPAHPVRRFRLLIERAFVP